MKKILFFMFFLLISCGNKEDNKIKNETIVIADSTIVNSRNHIMESDTIQRKSDSITQEKIVKVITNIKYLTNTVEKLKIEKSLLSITAPFTEPVNEPVNEVADTEPKLGFIVIFPVEDHNVSGAAEPFDESTNNG